MLKKLGLVLSLLMIASCGFASRVTVKMYKTTESGQGAHIGNIEFADTSSGLLIEPHLHGLPPGLHGFHIHAKPSCKNAGMAAGGHLDPKHTDKHLGPRNSKGHLGDLPVLVVAKNGETPMPGLARRLRVSDIRHHAVMIHAGGDNYSDQPKKLGGGGARIACGVVK